MNILNFFKRKILKTQIINENWEFAKEQMKHGKFVKAAGWYFNDSVIFMCKNKNGEYIICEPRQAVTHFGSIMPNMYDKKPVEKFALECYAKIESWIVVENPNLIFF